MAKSTQEICKAISEDLKLRRITHQIAADKIGTSKQTVSNQLSGKKKFSTNMAQKFANAFGYDTNFLLYGVGDMFAEGRGYFKSGKYEDGMALYYIGYQNEPFKYGKQIRAAERIIEILNNKVAIEAFHAYMNDDYDKYDELIEILESDYSYNIPMMGYTPEQTKALRATRKWFTDVETKAAKELVLIEQKASNGEIIDVNAELERFRKRIIWIKDAYKSDAKSRFPNLDLSEYVTEDEKAELKTLMPDTQEGEE